MRIKKTIQYFAGVTNSSETGKIQHRHFTDGIIANKIEIFPEGLANFQPIISYDFCTCGQYFFNQSQFLH